jgi:hypothetical protein
MEPALSQFDKIQILLHEYDRLGNELGQHYSATFQALSVLALVVTGLVTVIATKGLNKLLVGLIGGTIVFYIIMILWIDYATVRTAKRICEIERDINARVGEPLLTLETHGVMHYFVKCTPKSAPVRSDKNSN